MKNLLILLSLILTSCSTLNVVPHNKSYVVVEKKHIYKESWEFNCVTINTNKKLKVLGLDQDANIKDTILIRYDSMNLPYILSYNKK